MSTQRWSARCATHGAIITCKTTTCESGYKLTADSPVSGVTRNPWRVDRTSGGSSGGAAAAVAAGCGPLALGTDGVGSIRVPSSFCGVFGIKPTFGLVSRAPGFSPPSWASLAHTGPIGRTVRDVALLLEVIAGHDVRDAASLPVTQREFDATPMPLGGHEDRASPRISDLRAVSPEVRSAFASCGGCAERARVPSSSTDHAGHRSRGARAHHQTDRLHRTGGRSRRPGAEPSWRVPTATITASLRAGASIAAPTTSMPRIGARNCAVDSWNCSGGWMCWSRRRLRSLHSKPARSEWRRSKGVRSISTWAGRRSHGRSTWRACRRRPFRAASINEGLPVGMQIIAPWLEEGRIFRVAAAFEAARPWRERWPGFSRRMSLQRGLSRHCSDHATRAHGRHADSARDTRAARLRRRSACPVLDTTTDRPQAAAENIR